MELEEFEVAGTQAGGFLDPAPPGSDTPSAYLIRQELLQGLSGLKVELQETLRKTLREELPLAFASAGIKEGTPKAFAPRAPPHADATLEVIQVGNGDANTISMQPKHGGGKPLSDGFDGVLPGSVSTPTATSPTKSAPVVCDCGNVFLGDALFCRKCGHARPGTCTCGNILQADAKFCRKCGRHRELTVSTEDTNKPPDKDTPTMINSTTATPKSGKHKKTHGAKLFKEKGDTAPQSNLQIFTNSRCYETASGVLIIVNGLFLGFQAQILAHRAMDKADREEPLGEEPDAFFVVNFIFCVFFIVELVFRWAADGLVEFLRTDQSSWNILDIVIVLSSVLEIVVEIVQRSSSMDKTEMLSNVSAIRMLRVLRIVRVARVIRVMKFFRELRMMIYSILGSVKNLVWVMIVLFMTFYMFGVSFSCAVRDYLDTSEKWKSEDNQALVEGFGTVDRSILALFMSMSGGNDWSQYYDSLVPLPVYYRWFYLLFIVFSLFAVANIVTGVFVESALQANLKDKDIIVHEEMQAKKRYLLSMQELFEEMDEEAQGTLSLHEFEDKLKDERVIAYFRNLKLDVSDAWKLFQLLDYDNSDEIGIEEFLEGCYQLQGVSSALDMKLMIFEIHHLQEKFKDFHLQFQDYLLRGQLTIVQEVCEKVSRQLN